jgi:hypothetical protein
MLKAAPALAQALHTVIAAAWRSGHAPEAWKRALVVPVPKKGDPKIAGNWRPISLLSIPGKVYAMLIMHRIAGHIEGRLHEAQCGFRPQRGTTDAIFTLRRIASSCLEHKTPLALAFIDLTKAYDRINREALWKVLAGYGVPAHEVSLLRDLHTGTMAAVRLGAALGPEFEVTSGVRQGCVAAPKLFNVFMDFVVSRAFRAMPEACGVTVAYERPGAGITAGASTSNFATIAHLLYADDMTLLAHDPEQLRAMLQAMDQAALTFGMLINAAKTEVMYILPDSTPEPIVLSGGTVHATQAFKFLGSWIAQDGSMDKEVGVRRARLLSTFHSMTNVWRNHSLPIKLRARLYSTYVLPTALYGCETWNITKAHMQRLESAHTACLRYMLGVPVTQRHTREHIRTACGLPPLELLIAKQTFRWWGHVARMAPERLPYIAMRTTCPAPGNAKSRRPRGRPLQTHARTFDALAATVGRPNARATLFEDAQERVAWRKRVRSLKMAPPPKPAAPTRIQPRRSCRDRGTQPP